MKYPVLRLFVAAAFFLNCVLFSPFSYGESPTLPHPGSLVYQSPIHNEPFLRGVRLDPKNAFRFEFFMEGAEAKASAAQSQAAAATLIKYFLASLTIPSRDLWVNLSPYEHERIVPEQFGRTEMGRDMLAQDYLLKQITASLIYPETAIGRNFWDEVYHKAAERYGRHSIPVNTFNKVWIMPDKAVVYEHNGTAYVLENHLKVMLEEDYTALAKHGKAGLAITSGKPDGMHAAASRTVREIVLPVLEREVNQGANFARLRQIFSALILATWYKSKIKDSVINRIYSGRAKISGIDVPEADKEMIYQRYLAAFKKGVFNYVREEPDVSTGRLMPRKYFAGGVVGTAMDEAMTVVNRMPEGAVLGERIERVKVDMSMASAAETDAMRARQEVRGRIVSGLMTDLGNVMKAARASLDLLDAWRFPGAIGAQAAVEDYADWGAHVVVPARRIVEAVEARAEAALREYLGASVGASEGNTLPLEELVADVMDYLEQTRAYWDRQPAAMDGAVRVPLGVLSDTLKRAVAILSLPSRIRKDHLSPNKAHYSIKELMAEVLELMRSEIEGHHIHVEASYGDMGNGMIFIRRGDFDRILLNLLLNAVAAFDGPANADKIKRVWVRVEKFDGRGGTAEENVYRIQVQDNGAGISAQDLPKVFQPFFTTGEADGHSGLGLTFVKGTAEQEYGGQVAIASKQGEGTTVTVTLPAGQQVPDALEDADRILSGVNAEAVGQTITPDIVLRAHGWAGRTHDTRGNILPVGVWLQLLAGSVTRDLKKVGPGPESESQRQALARKAGIVAALEQRWAESVLTPYFANKDLALGRIRSENLSGFGFSGPIVLRALLDAGVLIEAEREQPSDPVTYQVRDNLDDWQVRYRNALHISDQEAHLIAAQRMLNDMEGAPVEKGTPDDVHNIEVLLRLTAMGSGEDPRFKILLYRRATRILLNAVEAFAKDLNAEERGVLETPAKSGQRSISESIGILKTYLTTILEDDGKLSVKAEPLDLNDIVPKVMQQVRGTDPEMRDALNQRLLDAGDGRNLPAGIVYVLGRRIPPPAPGRFQMSVQGAADQAGKWNFRRMQGALLLLKRQIPPALEEREVGVLIAFNMEEGLPRVMADKLLFGNIIENILNNAVRVLSKSDKYKRGKTRGESARWLAGKEDGPTVIINAKREDGHVVIRFIDNGPGFPEGVTAFEYGSSDQVGPGHGLGLYMVKLAAKAMGGDIVVEKTGPGGVTFKAWFPVAAEAQPSLSQGAPAEVRKFPDNAMAADRKGGIDFDTNNWDVKVRGSSQGFHFDTDAGISAADDIAGARFLIRSITPENNLPLILGLSTDPPMSPQPSASNATAALAKR